MLCAYGQEDLSNLRIIGLSFSCTGNYSRSFAILSLFVSSCMSNHYGYTEKSLMTIQSTKQANVLRWQQGWDIFRIWTFAAPPRAQSACGRRECCSPGIPRCPGSTRVRRRLSSSQQRSEWGHQTLQKCNRSTIHNWLRPKMQVTQA